MKEQLKFWIPIVLFIATALGWAYDSGTKSAKIEYLESQVKENKLSNEKQDEILNAVNVSIGRITGILEQVTD